MTLTAVTTRGSMVMPRSLRHLLADRWVAVMLVIVAMYLIIACAAGTGWLAGNWNDRVGPSLAPPSMQHLIGTDRLGRSVLRKMFVGAATSVSVTVIATTITITVGALLGAAAGYFRGWVDHVIVWLYTTIGSVPGLLMMLALAFVLRDASVWGMPLRGVPAVSLAIGATAWVGTCRLIRGEVIKHQQREYIQAATAIGCSRARIIYAHILPNVGHLLIIKASLMSVGFINAEVTLSFLGLGPTDRPSWGTMIDEARMEISQGAWWQMAAAAGAVFILCLAVHVIGDALRDAMDPKVQPRQQ